ncbi:hypothetical protein QOT17_021777 [Balamuthia mandrillaris]
MEGAAERQRIAALSAALAGDAMKDQVEIWKQERELLRLIVSQFWEQQGNQFIDWWLSSEQTVRTAMIYTALEDLPSGVFGALLQIVCPELLDVERLILIPEATANTNNASATEGEQHEEHSDNTASPSSAAASNKDEQQQQPTEATTVEGKKQSCFLIELMEHVCLQRENSKACFDAQGLSSGLQHSLQPEEAGKESLSSSSTTSLAQQALLTARTCLLLQFINALQLVYANMPLSF